MHGEWECVHLRGALMGPVRTFAAMVRYLHDLESLSQHLLRELSNLAMLESACAMHGRVALLFTKSGICIFGKQQFHNFSMPTFYHVC